MIEKYEVVIGCDADEYIVVEPRLGMNLAEYISSLNIKTSVSGLGFDVGQRQGVEETFAQNSFDIFTDCPTRERAGWLCDSFFLGRAEYEFTGTNLIERSFLENYMLPDGFENIDEILKDEHACMDFMSKWNDIALPKINLDCLRNKLLDSAPFKVINHKS